MSVVSMNYLLEAGVQFGHQTKKWNPKMKEYIFTARDGIYIIDLQKTVKKLEEAYAALNVIAANGGKVLFVGTKKQAATATKEEAERVSMYYVTERWLGGTLTNFKTIRNRVRRMEEIEAMKEDGTFDLLPKKEVAGLKKEHAKLFANLGGIRDMKKLPQALVVVDTSKEIIAIKEARKLNIPVFGLVDTNCDPDCVDYVIPGNDDAVRSVKVILGVLANAIAEANGLETVNYSVDDPARLKEIKEYGAQERKEKKEYNNNKFKKPYNRDGRDNREKREYNNNNNNSNNGNNYSKPAQKGNVISRMKEEVKNIRSTVKEEVSEVKKEIKESFKSVEKEIKEEVNEARKDIEKVTNDIAAKVNIGSKSKTTSNDDINSKSVAELRELAKENGVKGYSKMKKDELIEALK